MLKEMLIKGGMVVAGTLVAEVIIEKLEKRHNTIKSNKRKFFEVVSKKEDVEKNREEIDKEWEEIRK
jgi:hypothetical protein